MMKCTGGAQKKKQSELSFTHSAILPVRTLLLSGAAMVSLSLRVTGSQPWVHICINTSQP